MDREEKIAAVLKMMDIIVETVKEAGPGGVPAGPLYAVFMTFGCSLGQFQTLADGLIKSGALRRTNNCYFFLKERTAAQKNSNK